MSFHVNFVHVNFILDSQLQCMNSLVSRNSKRLKLYVPAGSHEFDGGKWKDKSDISQPK